MSQMVAWLLVAVTIALGSGGGVWKLTADHYQGEIAKLNLTWAQAVGAGQQAQLDAIAENEKKIQNGKAKYVEAKKVVEILLDYPVGRVLLPACPATQASGVQVTTSLGSQFAVEPAGVFFEKAERILAEDRRRTRSIEAEAETELNECRVSKFWAAENMVDWEKAQGE